MLSRLFRFLRRSKPAPSPVPQIFHSPEAFCAAMRGHSEVRRCFAWGQYLLDSRERKADCVIHAGAYASDDDYTAPPLFTMVHTIYEAAPWPLPRPLFENLQAIIDTINASARPAQKETDNRTSPTLHHSTH